MHIFYVDWIQNFGLAADADDHHYMFYFDDERGIYDAHRLPD